MAYLKQAILRLENAIPSQGVLSLIGGIQGRWPMVDLTRVYGTDVGIVLYIERPLRGEELCYALGVAIGFMDLDPESISALRTLLLSRPCHG